MAKREYVGQPIDMTDGPGETHLSERNGETVAGSSDDDLHDENTDSWPSVLDREWFSDQQQEIISKLSVLDPIKDSEMADIVGCSGESVRQVRHKASAFAHPDELPFEAPDEPTTSIKIVNSILTDSGSIPRKENGSDEDIDVEDSSTSDSGTTTLPRDEIAELYDSGHSASEIASKLDLDTNRVCGAIGSLVAQGRVKSQSDGGETEKIKETDSVEPEEDTEADTDSQNTNGVSVELSVDELLEIMEGRGVSRETKKAILKQGGFE